MMARYPSDQTLVYAAAAGVDSVTVYEKVGIIEDAALMALDIGLRPGVTVTLGAGLKIDFDVRTPREPRERDWERRLKKRRRR